MSTHLDMRPPSNDLEPCRLWLGGHCRFGERCNFAHGENHAATNVRYTQTPLSLEPKVFLYRMIKVDEGPIWTVEERVLMQVTENGPGN